MTFAFRPARREQAGLFVALAGGTNSGKTFSGLRLARGIAGPVGKIAAIDTEAGRMSHYASDFSFDVVNMQGPFRPERFAQAAVDAEEAGYSVLLIDSFSMEWVGPGGVLDWQAEEFKRMGGKESAKMASWIKPKMGHKAMVYSFLQRRIPIVFALRAEEKTKVGPDNKPVTSWAPICNKAFPFELTVSFMLSASAKGVVDLSLPWKMEKDHQPIFRDGDLIAEEHGARLAAWAAGNPEPAPVAADRAALLAADLIERADDIETAQALFALVDDAKAQEQRAWLKNKRPELSQDVEAAFMAADARTKVAAPAEAVPE
jgi:hypothetical protein